MASNGNGGSREDGGRLGFSLPSRKTLTRRDLDTSHFQHTSSDHSQQETERQRRISNLSGHSHVESVTYRYPVVQPHGVLAYQSSITSLTSPPSYIPSPYPPPTTVGHGRYYSQQLPPAALPGGYGQPSGVFQYPPDPHGYQQQVPQHPRHINVSNKQSPQSQQQSSKPCSPENETSPSMTPRLAASLIPIVNKVYFVPFFAISDLDNSDSIQRKRNSAHSLLQRLCQRMGLYVLYINIVFYLFSPWYTFATAFNFYHRYYAVNPGSNLIHSVRHILHLTLTYHV
jgi:hypothetical protein